MTEAILDTALFLLERFGEAVDREYLTTVVRLEIEASEEPTMEAAVE